MRETSHKCLFAERRCPTNITREPLLEYHRALKNPHRIYVGADKRRAKKVRVLKRVEDCKRANASLGQVKKIPSRLEMIFMILD